jgi:hypothetical protein
MEAVDLQSQRNHKRRRSEGNEGLDLVEQIDLTLFSNLVFVKVWSNPETPPKQLIQVISSNLFKALQFS